jgi:hypothetical protein
MARLHGKQDRLTVTDYLMLGKNAVLKFIDSTGATNEVSLTELEALDGLTASTDEINRACDVSSRVVTITATDSVTESEHEGRVNLLGEVGGDAAVTLTLPAASGSGARYYFCVSVVNTSNYVIKVDSASATIDGTVMSLADGGDTVVGFEADGTDDTITLNGTTTGGAAIGDWIELIDIATNQWAVSGQTTSTGAEATPFSATVS